MYSSVFECIQMYSNIGINKTKKVPLNFLSSHKAETLNHGLTGAKIFILMYQLIKEGAHLMN